ncbi:MULTISPECIES: hypothetical protein [unclassified Mycolicibacterium]|uniref:hypothetical protein n=1 Tax=unclassified Mycolicibacterium TaxID=2636767 RepID=UPI0012DEBF09|nr:MULTISPECIES: hypothetical protein [unclassified Mycolicibacterium]MUL80759.1 hypothetical protein [Mycolicibacterium sp. CBMA 329]MUL86526.1 hypothetical protein [Mycolicibacterium sp. CBMA 331]MUM01387.1 hypothetical protein [Mycolicibacterium sp. CBMA 334]MUM25896.1 hypothetical protein [Mycolicibacterium sp. CBMA 295]MUM36822.1 hypothetical protein [Mycolicibacterium sp. CBMA 247]
MQLTDLSDHVGAGLFERACEHALATAADTGTRLDVDPWPADCSDVPHELADLVEGDLPLAFRLYRAMPCFANLMYVPHWGSGPVFWAELRALLDESDQRLRDPVLYWLWCGPFEGSPAEAGEAWREITADADDARLRYLLPVSGPVPWPEKSLLLDRLSRSPQWQPVVLAAVEAAANDVFGSIDIRKARKLVARIRPMHPELRARLDELEARLRPAVSDRWQSWKSKPRKLTRVRQR